MRCKNCKAPLEDDWKFCPYCGERITKLFIPFFKIDINKSRNQLQVKKVIEPEAKITPIPNGIKVILRLPKVKNAEDIRIRKFEESIEIRAEGKDVTYFKVIPTFKDANIIENKFVNELLKLVIIR